MGIDPLDDIDEFSSEWNAIMAKLTPEERAIIMRAVDDPHRRSPEDHPPVAEDGGICKQCQKGEHDICPMVMGGNKSGMAFCTCRCQESPTGETRSLGASEKFNIPKRVSRELRMKFPRHEHDPLDEIF